MMTMLGLAVPTVEGYELEDRGGFWKVDTCNCTTAPRLHRFKACKLISLREMLVDAFEVVKDFKRELTNNHRMTIPETNEITGTNSQFELLHDGYDKIQQLALDFLVLEQIQTITGCMVLNQTDFTYGACRLRHHFKRLMCQIKPVLNAGVFGGVDINTSCMVRRRMESTPTRNAVLNFAGTLLFNSINDIRWMIASINLLLTDI